jgi:hypothetical protein
MIRAVAKPIPLRAGRWSIHPRSKGNFVYSFDGNIPFDVITSYEHILLQPFHGSGQLRPSLGWTRLLAHGVPLTDNDGLVFDTEALMEEVRLLPGLKKAFFSMAPRWLKPIQRITGYYSSITFAISDPDGAFANTLMNNRAALFGKEVTIERWIDKPALIQCSHCHALGHTKASRICPLGRDSVKCFICGGAHRSEKHDQHCGRKHTVAGICDCKHFKCLNCYKTGHTCKDPRCPARELYRPKVSRRVEQARNKGKARETGQAPGPEGPIAGPSTAPRADVEENPDSDGDLYDPPVLPTNPTRQAKTAARNKSYDRLIDGIYRWEDRLPLALSIPLPKEGEPDTHWPMDDDEDEHMAREEESSAAAGGVNYDVGDLGWEYPTAITRYSPSRPQSGATSPNLA